MKLYFSYKGTTTLSLMLVTSFKKKKMRQKEKQKVNYTLNCSPTEILALVLEPGGNVECSAYIWA